MTAELKPIAEIEKTIPVLDACSTDYRIRLEGEQYWRRVMRDGSFTYVNVKRKPVYFIDDRVE